MVAPSRSSTIWGLWARASPLTDSAANVTAARRAVRIIKFWIFIFSFVLHFNCFLQPHVRGRGAQHDADFSRFHHEAVLASVPIGQISPFHGQPDGPRFVRLERDALKSSEFFYGPLHRGIEVLNVQLHYLIAGAGPGVFDVHARDHLARGSHGIGRQAQVGVLEYGSLRPNPKGYRGCPLKYI